MMDEYQECAKIIKESPAMIGVAFLLNLLQRVSVVAVTYCVYMGSGQTGHSFIDIMKVQGYVLIGSNSLTVPGAVGIADYLFFDGFRNIFADHANGEILSRGLSFYVCIIVCGGLTLAHHARFIIKSIPARAERVSAHRTCQVHSFELRTGKKIQWNFPYAF